MDKSCKTYKHNLAMMTGYCNVNEVGYCNNMDKWEEAKMDKIMMSEEMKVQRYKIEKSNTIAYPYADNFQSAYQYRQRKRAFRI